MSPTRADQQLTRRRRDGRARISGGAVLVALAAAGCGTTTLGDVGTGVVRAHHHRGYYGGAPSAASGTLPASSTTVQPQPAPGSCHSRGSGLLALPDATCTPGATNPAVTTATLRSTICRTGWTKTVRPPESVTGPEKRASMAAYGDQGSPSGYEYDHLIPLEVGGAPNDPRNLWPEPQAGPPPNIKDRVENRLKTLVCDGQVPLAQAQQMLATDWTAAYRRYVGQ